MYVVDSVRADSFNSLTPQESFGEAPESIIDSKGEAKDKLNDEDKQELESNLNVATSAASAEEELTNIFELLGTDIEHYDNYVVIKGNAILKNTEAYILADEIIYNPSLKQARLKGNVRIYKSDELSIVANQATIYLNVNYGIIRPFYIQDTKTGIWMSSESASKQRTIYRFVDSVVSGCSYTNPTWRINSSSGHYDQDSKILSLWNPRIYIGDVPVFYLPYLRFSLTNERSSGLLYPTTGNSGVDGFVYIQPYYLALQNFWDMTISPQVRSSKGVGANLEFRAIDSTKDIYILHSKYFYNFDSYMQQYNALNQHIFGFDFKHSKRNVIQKYFGANIKVDNGMYFDVAYMNDIDYMRLDDLRYYLNTTHYISRINLYTQTNNHYFGLNMRYYLNLYSPYSKTTIHNVPNFQYHKYLSSVFIKELLYSFDYQMKNGLRQDGYNYLLNEITLPIGLNMSFLNKYFSIGAWINLNAGNVVTSNNENTQIYTSSPNNMGDGIRKIGQVGVPDSGNYANASYRLSLNTDIGRKYNKVFHSVQFGAIFSGPFEKAYFSNGIISEKIVNDFGNLSNTQLSNLQSNVYLWDPSIVSNLLRGIKRLDLNFSNYFYNSKGAEMFYWRATQSFNFNDSESALKIPMENKIGTSPIKGLNLSSSFFYSWFYNSITELAFSVSYARSFYALGASYYIKRDDALWSYDPVTLSYSPVDATNYLNVSFKGDLGYFGLLGDISYDFKTNNIINIGFGIYKDMKCFGIGIKAGSTRTPFLSYGGNINVINNMYAKVEFKFVPLTSFNYTYRLRPRVSE